MLLCRAGLGFGVGGGISLRDISAVPKSSLARGGFSSSSAPPQPWILLLAADFSLWMSPLPVGLLSENLPAQLLLPLLLPIPLSAQGLHLRRFQGGTAQQQY